MASTVLQPEDISVTIEEGDFCSGFLWFDTITARYTHPDGTIDEAIAYLVNPIILEDSMPDPKQLKYPRTLEKLLSDPIRHEETIIRDFYVVLDHVLVQSEHRRSGVGRALVAAVLDSLTKKGLGKGFTMLAVPEPMVSELIKEAGDEDTLRDWSKMDAIKQRQGNVVRAFFEALGFKKFKESRFLVNFDKDWKNKPMETPLWET